MVKAVDIPVTVKMRKGWDDDEINAKDVARRVADAGAVGDHDSRAHREAVVQRQRRLGIRRGRGGGALAVPVFGSGDCIEPEQIVERLREGVSGVFVGRGVLRNPWILAQAQDMLEGRPARHVSREERGQFLLDYIELLLNERVHEEDGFRHVAPGPGAAWSSLERASAQAKSGGPVPRHDRWVINKLRALCSWYTKGLDGGSHLRTSVNSAAHWPNCAP